MKITLPLPKKYPKNFKQVEQALFTIMKGLEEFREKYSGKDIQFLDEWENLYLRSMEKTGEEQRIQRLTLLMVWSQYMTLVTEKK